MLFQAPRCDAIRFTLGTHALLARRTANACASTTGPDAYSGAEGVARTISARKLAPAVGAGLHFQLHNSRQASTAGPRMPQPIRQPHPLLLTLHHSVGALQGTGWPAVNGDPNLQLFDANMPPELPPTYLIGPAFPGYLVSEFGCVSTSSFESLSPTLAPSHWSLHGGVPSDVCVGDFFRNCSSPATGQPGNALAQRNYPMDSIIASFFGKAELPSLDAVSAVPLQRQVFLAMLGAALQIKSHIEYLRAAPSWGALFWQMNEGSCECGRCGVLLCCRWS